jgi:hypothetical protein
MSSIEVPKVVQIDRADFDIAFELLKNGNPKLSCSEAPLKIGRLLGKGGTKSVYSSLVRGEQVALALPNKVDTVSVAASKWQLALREPVATAIVRDLGFW